MERLEHMLWLGRTNEAQMIAQEIRRRSGCHPSSLVRGLLTEMDESTGQFIHPHFELGVVLTADEGRWLAGLIENAERLARQSQRTSTTTTTALLPPRSTRNYPTKVALQVQSMTRSG